MNKPRQLDPIAERVLSALSRVPGAEKIILGGYFALQHYVDYRRTHDIDAWWKDRVDPDADAAIREAMRQVGDEQHLELRERRFGDTLSFELARAGAHVFSFQIAVRTIALEEPYASAWPPILIETLADNVGAKMNALVSRGAPRDFLDIKAVVDNGLLSSTRCWALWEAKNPGASAGAARQNVLVHLSGIEARRPLHVIADAEARAQAQAARGWFKDEFVKA
jgi:hypothetical protein